MPPLPLPECRQHTKNGESNIKTLPSLHDHTEVPQVAAPTQADSVDVIDAEFFELVNQGMAEEDLRKELAKLGIGTDGERATLA